MQSKLESNYSVGQWALIEPGVKNTKGGDILPFLAQITSVNKKDKIINFNVDNVYHTDGSKRVPSNVNGKTLNYSLFSWIKKTSSNKKDLLLSEIRKIIRSVLSEEIESLY